MTAVTVNVAAQNMDPGLTPAQGRVVFHQERLLRSTGTHPGALRGYLARCFAAGLPEVISLMTREQCATALRALEDACREAGLGRVRDCRTQWEGL